MSGDQLSFDDALIEAKVEWAAAIDDRLAELTGDPGRVIPSRTSDPDTSRVAERVVKVKAGTQRARLLKAFYVRHRSQEPLERLATGLDVPPNLLESEGLTDEQAMLCAEGVYPTSEYAKRCSELREGGFIQPTGETRLGAAGTPRIVSRITPKGAAWIRENQS